jgi:hypothetical protein
MPVERRNYAREYAMYHSSPKQKKRRAQRNAARRKMMKAGKVHKGDGKDVDHKDMNTSHNSISNLRVQSKHKNRARNRGHGGRPKGGRKKLPRRGG